MTDRKTATIEVRVTPEQKADFQRAARAEGLSLSAFVVHALTRAARRVKKG